MSIFGQEHYKHHAGKVLSCLALKWLHIATKKPPMLLQLMYDNMVLVHKACQLSKRRINPGVNAYVDMIADLTRITLRVVPAAPCVMMTV